MAVDFSKILSKQADQIEKPKPIPVGTYLCNNPQLPKFLAIGKNETPCAEFSLVILAPQEDVSDEDLASFGDIRGKHIRHRMFLTEGTEYRTKEELVNAFGAPAEGMSLGQMFNETINRQVLATIKHRPSDDGTTMYSEVEKLAAA